MTTEYYNLVPKDRRKNLEFRKWMIQLGTEDLEQRSELWMMCSRDILFYINVFGWLLEPRAVGDGCRKLWVFGTLAFTRAGPPGPRGCVSISRTGTGGSRSGAR